MAARVVFACVQNAGRSQMAAAFFNALADPTRAIAVSAGTAPAARVHPAVIQVMGEKGFDLSTLVPQHLTPEMAAATSHLITMGCGEACPFIAGTIRDDWPLPDPDGRPLDEVRSIRDAIAARVADLVARHNWWRPRSPSSNPS